MSIIMVDEQVFILVVTPDIYIQYICMICRGGSSRPDDSSVSGGNDLLLEERARDLGLLEVGTEVHADRVSRDNIAHRRIACGPADWCRVCWRGKTRQNQNRKS